MTEDALTPVVWIALGPVRRLSAPQDIDDTWDDWPCCASSLPRPPGLPLRAIDSRIPAGAHRPRAGGSVARLISSRGW